MKTFHKLLSTASKNQSPYLQALKALTQASAAQLAALSSGLDWQTWAPTSAPARA